ncbi:MAG: hypothetical protein WCW66_06455 [Patescibacteria group bacterium]
MKSLDAAKKAPVEKRKGKTPRKRSATRLIEKKQIAKTSTENEKAKHLRMWVLVICFMVVVVVGWVYFLRYSLEDDLSKRGGGLDEITKGFNRLFHVVDNQFDDVQDAYSDLQNFQEQLNEADIVTEEVQGLREKVFPQFENINTNSNI